MAGTSSSSTLCDRMLVGPGSCRSCVGNHSCSEFKSELAMPCNARRQHPTPSFPSSTSCILPVLSPSMVIDLWRERYSDSEIHLGLRNQQFLILGTSSETTQQRLPAAEGSFSNRSEQQPSSKIFYISPRSLGGSLRLLGEGPSAPWVLVAAAIGVSYWDRYFQHFRGNFKRTCHKTSKLAEMWNEGEGGGSNSNESPGIQ